MYAGALSNPGFNWICSPAATELEMAMMDWSVQLLGLDDAFLTSNGIGGGIIMVNEVTYFDASPQRLSDIYREVLAKLA